MAKLETISVKKSKAKKRKHTNTENEDEVANKSVIVEAPEVEDQHDNDEPMQTKEVVPAEQVTTKKSKKRKNKEKGDTKEKRSKSQDENDSAEQKNHEDGGDSAVGGGKGNDFHEPTLEELKESEKPENNLAILTGRQKKKQKHLKLMEAQKGHSTEKEKQRNEEYLNKWKHTRDDWKFEKLRQISIQHTMFEGDKLDASVWPIALEYLAGSKGAAKDKIVKLANDVIDEIDKLCEEKESDEDKQAIVNSVKYQRARDLLQIFD